MAYYWDVESGGNDLEDRGHSDAWQAAATAGIPRDGGIADLLNQAKSPVPDFAFVVCENIERSARDTYNSLKLERELQDQGIPLFATDEPFSVEGINATTILVRRVKQGVAEWFRLQLKDAVWSGLKEHSLAGWNLGKVPIGYTGEKHPHPNPIKAAEGRTKTRLTPNPVYGPIIGQIYRWRVNGHLGKPTIRARLAADPITYPPPSPAGWSLALVDEILSNPKYTGHQVMGRRRRKAGKKIWMPASEWIWTAEPTHTALVDKATWDAAQQMGRRHGNISDPEMPTRRTGRRYKLRSRLYCSICHRRLSGTTIRAYTYYRCPHEPGLPRHYAAHPVEHPGFGGDSILPRCSGLGGRCLPRYRRLAEPRSDHFPLLFCRTSVQLRCPAAPPGGGLCRQAPAGGELGHLLVGHPLCAAGSPGRARVTRSVIACDAGGALDLGGGSVAPVPRPARRCPPAAAPVLTCQAISEEGRGPGRSPGGCGRSPPG